jgi:hypothetical protein
MTRIYFVCLILCLTAMLLSSQSNPVPQINRATLSVVSSVNASQHRSQPFRVTARQAAPMQTQGPIFAPAVTYASGGLYAISVVVADVNGDGKPDLLVANSSSSTVGVLLGNGDGTFQTAVSYGSGGVLPSSVVVADVNGDGKPDLLVTNVCVDSYCTSNSSVSVLLGNGDGTFQAAVTYGSGGWYADSVAVADVNGDGKPDLVVGNACVDAGCASGTVGVLLGNGDGTFQTAVSYGSGGYSGAIVAVADVNGDGKPDLLVANYCGSGCLNGTVSVLLGNGDGTFQRAVTYGSGAFEAYSLAVADVNGDGKPDLVVSNACQSSEYGTCNSSSEVSVLLGNGDGTFQTAVSYDSGESGSGYGEGAYSVAVADVNGDGKADLIVINQGNNVGVLLGNGDGTFQSAVTYGSGGNAYGVAVADVNGDGKPDVVVANSGSETVGVLINISKATTTTALASSVNPSVQGKPVTFTAVVSSLAGTPTGKVQFLNGAKVLAMLKLTSGSAKYTTSKLPPGASSITAVYEGDSNNSGSTSSPVNQFVLAATKTTLSSFPNPSTYGEAVTFTAVVTSSIGAPPDGETVTFKKGTTVLGMGTLNGGSASFTTSTLKVGTTTVTAVYSGDSDFAGTTSKPVKQVVEKAGGSGR